MERRVKERLIGAGILVAVIVVFVPQLLSGPPQKPPPPAPMSLPKPAAVSDAEPVRNVTVDLNTSRPTASEPDSASADAPPPASAVAPPPSGTVAPPPAAPLVPAPAVPVQSPAPHAALESPAPSPTSSGAWSVQVGTFASRSNAENLVRQLKGQGYSAYLAPQGSGRTERFRVRVGPQADRGAAEHLQTRLKGQGHAGTLMSPGH